MLRVFGLFSLALHPLFKIPNSLQKKSGTMSTSSLPPVRH